VTDTAEKDAEEEEPPPLDVPDPHQWPSITTLWAAVQDVRVAEEVLETLSGKTPQAAMSQEYREALSFVAKIVATCRENLAAQLLHDIGGFPYEDPEQEPAA
jgi:hypothetical protein